MSLRNLSKYVPENINEKYYLRIINEKGNIMLQLFDKVRKTVLIYRFLRFRRGFGVHSPFAFNLITKVIDERCPYYCFDRIDIIRKQIKYKSEYNSKSLIKVSHGELLFRLMNYIKPRKILQIGGDCISSLYYNAYSSGLQSVLIKEDKKDAELSDWAFSNMNIKLEKKIGEYSHTLDEVFEDIPIFDFVFFNCSDNSNSISELFNKCIKHIHPDTVFVIEGIRDNKNMRLFWDEVKNTSEVVITFDLYNIGFVFFNKRLHRKDYIVYF